MHNSDHPQTDVRVAVVIEDDPDIRDLIITVFQQSGFTVHAAVDGVSGVEQVRQHAPTVVTLDLGLPDIDGFEVTRRIRLDSDCYIIMLSARTDEAEALMGLGAGADDFITKPFRPRELRARIAAMLRRPRGPARAPDAEEVRHESGAKAETDDSAAEGALPPPSAERLEHNGLTVDPQTRLVWLNQRQVELTRTEFDLLLSLMRSGRRVRTKTDLVRHLRADHLDAQTYVSDADERAVEVHIGNLRRKLGQSGQVPTWIETVRGVGYRMSVVHAASP